MPNPLMQMMGGNNPMTAMMQNNPVFKLVQAMKSGNGNPMQMLQQMAGNNPQAKQVLDMMQQGNSQGLKEMAMNMAKQKGTSVEEIAKQLGIQLPE